VSSGYNPSVGNQSSSTVEALAIVLAEEEGLPGPRVSPCVCSSDNATIGSRFEFRRTTRRIYTMLKRLHLHVVWTD